LQVKHSRELRGADEEARNSGKQPSDVSYADFPVCFARAAQLNQEMRGAGAEGFLAVVNRERNCPKFIEWEPDCSPKEHAEMRREQQMREWQEARMKEDREWRDAREMKQKKGDRIWGLFTLVLGIVLGVILPPLLAWFKDQLFQSSPPPPPTATQKK
jgi:hypothetical protein